MSIRSMLRLFVLALIVFGVALGLRRAFFFDVTPVSLDQDPTSLWALGSAFLLLSVENLAAVVAALSLIIAFTLWLRGRRTAPAPNPKGQ
jgi:hypothetical protein